MPNLVWLALRKSLIRFLKNKPTVFDLAWIQYAGLITKPNIWNIDWLLKMANLFILMR
jgi:hypothetical protein